MNSNALQILVVEDDPNDLELALRVLRAEDPHLEVAVARDGEEALDFLLRRNVWQDRAAEEEPALVLLDLKLPKIGGLQVLQELKSRSDFAVPIVVLTSSGEHRDIAESYRLGANSYVQKPVNISDFRTAIRAIATYWLKISRSPSPPLGRPRLRAPGELLLKDASEGNTPR
jgi:two-component system, response regulator